MAGIPKKYKSLYLMKIFLEETDDTHALSISQINGLLEQNGLDPVSAKTLYQDIEALSIFGIDIKYESEGAIRGYHVVQRDFDLAELKLLVDSVQASRFITEKKTHSLVKKLERLSSRHEGQELHRQVLISGRVKSMNESIFNNIDAISRAINLDSQISFKYFSFDTNKKRILRHDGMPYSVSPWALVYDNENYYMVAFDNRENKLKHYRIDKMLNIELTGHARIGREFYHKEDYLKMAVFGMFGGAITTVTLQAEDWMVGIIIDRFGPDVSIIKVDENHFRVNVEVALSKQFYGWLLGLGEGIRLIGPSPVVEELRHYLTTLNQMYISNR